MKLNHLIFLFLITAASFSCSHVDEKAVKPTELSGITKSGAGLGIPNGSSAGESYLEWLVPSDKADYGYTKENPVEIGGLLEGMGNAWPTQYFSSLLGPNGEPTRFERVKSCCGFEVRNPKILAEGIKVGFLDVYRVTIEGKEPVYIYMSLYSEERIFAPMGFTTRGKKP
jgi:hypothetical protein